MATRFCAVLGSLVLLSCAGSRANLDDAVAAIATHPELEPLSAPGLRFQLPERAHLPLRVEATRVSGFYADVAALVDPVVAVDRGSLRVFVNALPGTSLALKTADGSVEELRVLHDDSAPSVARWRIATGPAVASMRAREGRIELLDASGYVHLGTAPIYALDARGVRRDAALKVDGDIVEASIDVGGLAYPIVLDPAWTTMATMAEARHFHASENLSGGRVLVMGGNSSAAGMPISSAEIYDAKTNTWSATGSLTVPRVQFKTAIVKSGTAAGKLVVVSGGLTSAEWYDPIAGTFKALAPMKATKQSLQLMSVTSFIVAIGGASAERWNSYGDTWDPLPAPTGAPASLLAVAMNDNRILIVHGMKDYVTQDCLDTVEILDPLASTIAPAAKLPTKRCVGSLTLLPSGKVLAAGGTIRDVAYPEMEVYDPATDSWSKVAPKPAYKGGFKSALLGSGKVLFFGGYVSDPTNVVSEIYDPIKDTWGVQVPWTTARILTGVSTLTNGGVLVTGGISMSTSSKLAEVFDEGGNKCTKAEDCGSRLCVDGVCCDRACDGQCEACDVAGSVGTCATITGAPHGSRTPCDGGGGDACKAKTCDGKDNKTCAGLPPATVDCKAATCADGAFTAAAKCDGKGTCAVPMAQGCGDYQCSATGCLNACESAADCKKGLVCKSRACVPGCSADKMSAVGPDGREVPCNAYACDGTTGACRDSCTDTSQCGSGYVCDVPSKTCARQQPETDDGGCSLGHAAGGSSMLLLWLCAIAARRLIRRA
jgi:hypothetical protein